MADQSAHDLSNMKKAALTDALTLIRMAVLWCLTVLIPSCATEPPPPTAPEPPEVIAIEIEDVGVIEAWLRLTLADTVSDQTVVLERDGQPIDTTLISSSDTVLFDDALIPNQIYDYRAYRISGSSDQDTSEIIHVTTLDTTSHEFTWEMFEFGDYASSQFLDVSISNGIDLWAVGEMFLNDKTGQPDPDSYNAVHWNGQTWEVMRIPFQVCGTPSIGSPMIYSSFAFSPDDVWFTEGGNFVRWNGITFEQICVPEGIVSGTLSKIWGTSSDNLYAAGVNGAIIHWDGTTWESIESGTDVDINDVWGAMDVVTSDTIVYAAASNFDGFGDRLLIQIMPDGSTAAVSWDPQRSLQSVWFVSADKVLTCGGGIFVGTPGFWTEVSGFPLYLSERIRGSGRNDIVVVGHFGLFGHFNGMTWRYYPELASNGIYYSVDATENTVVAVGQIGSRATILRGHH